LQDGVGASVFLDGLLVAVAQEMSALAAAKRTGHKMKTLRGRSHCLTEVQSERFSQMVYHFITDSRNDLMSKLGIPKRRVNTDCDSLPRLIGAWEGVSLGESLEYAASVFRRAVDRSHVPLWFVCDETRLRQALDGLRTREGMKVVGNAFSVVESENKAVVSMADDSSDGIGDATQVFDVFAKRGDCYRVLEVYSPYNK